VCNITEAFITAVHTIPLTRVYRTSCLSLQPPSQRLTRHAICNFFCPSAHPSQSLPSLVQQHAMHCNPSALDALLSGSHWSLPSPRPSHICSPMYFCRFLAYESITLKLGIRMLSCGAQCCSYHLLHHAILASIASPSSSPLRHHQFLSGKSINLTSIPNAPRFRQDLFASLQVPSCKQQLNRPQAFLFPSELSPSPSLKSSGLRRPTPLTLVDHLCLSTHRLHSIVRSA
jgi:hypothetical protein